jgi:hypothetical protein
MQSSFYLKPQGHQIWANPVWKIIFFLFNIEGYGEFFSGITPFRQKTRNLFLMVPHSNWLWTVTIPYLKSTKCRNMKLLKFLILAIFFNIICPFTTKHIKSTSLNNCKVINKYKTFSTPKCYKIHQGVMLQLQYEYYAIFWKIFPMH